MLEYQPEKFAKWFHENDGQAIWTALNRDDNVCRMEAATYLRRPAAEPLSPGLLKEFGEAISEKHTKRMIGHMIRQIMERRGHAFERSNVTIRTTDNIFSTAARYNWDGV